MILSSPWINIQLNRHLWQWQQKLNILHSIISWGKSCQSLRTLSLDVLTSFWKDKYVLEMFYWLALISSVFLFGIVWNEALFQNFHHNVFELKAQRQHLTCINNEKINLKNCMKRFVLFINIVMNDITNMSYSKWSQGSYCKSPHIYTLFTWILHTVTLVYGIIYIQDNSF